MTSVLFLIASVVLLAFAGLFAADLLADFSDGPRDRSWIFGAVLAAMSLASGVVLFARAFSS